MMVEYWVTASRSGDRGSVIERCAVEALRRPGDGAPYSEADHGEAHADHHAEGPEGDPDGWTVFGREGFEAFEFGVGVASDEP